MARHIRLSHDRSDIPPVCDVTIHVQNNFKEHTRLFAHKSILQRTSPYFNRIFESRPSQHFDIVFVDTDSHTVREGLQNYEFLFSFLVRVVNKVKHFLCISGRFRPFI